MSNTSPLLEVKNLRVEFPTRRGTLVALDDVSFNISPARCSAWSASPAPASP
jgi:peptide/nickel transport system ATP-binding protein